MYNNNRPYFAQNQCNDFNKDKNSK